MCKKLAYILILLLSTVFSSQAQKLRLAGRVFDADTGKPIEFASILLSESGLWAVTDSQGEFVIQNVPEGKSTMTVQCLGYQKRVMPMMLNASVPKLSLRLKPENLKLSEVTVTAKRKTDEATTSYTIDRQTLDNHQLLRHHCFSLRQYRH